MDELKAKQQVVEKIKANSKILVTVSDSPSVDALSAALALAMILDKQEKYATAIFSGETPPAIAFLEPEKTFDDTTDSLRDFIIALNKEKADHLRYKLDGDSVKIFITPYRTTITEKDLEFSQGDYNVELVIALGVDNQDHLDHALEKGGQILHDATIITMTAGTQTSDLGGIDWHDSDSSSLSEMVAGLAEALKDDKKKTLVDESIATALLTGIVAETDRFSNEHTSSRTMSVAASLMSAGADQQLIATELQTPAPAVEEKPADNDDVSDTKESGDNRSEDVHAASAAPASPADATLLSIEHDETLADIDRRIRGEEASKRKIAEELESASSDSDASLEDTAPVSITSAEDDVATANVSASDMLAGAIPQISHVISERRVTSDDDEEPTFGGTLNATADQAEDDARKDTEDDQNKVILSHSPVGGSDAATPTADTYAPAAEPVVQPTPPIEEASTAQTTPIAQPDTAETPVQSPVPSAPADFGLPLPPPVPDFSQLNGSAPVAPPSIQPAMPPFNPSGAVPSATEPERLGDIRAPEPVGIDPVADVSAATHSAYAYAAPVTTEGQQEAALDAIVQPPLASSTPIAPLSPSPATEAYAPPQPPAEPTAPADPGQYQIPPQQ